MIEQIIFKQEKPQKVNYLGGAFLLLAVATWGQLTQMITLAGLGIICLGYSTTIHIHKDFRIYKMVSFLGASILKLRIKTDYPEYVSIFAASFREENEFGPVSALGTTSKHKDIVIRLFKGNKHITIFKTNDYLLAKEKATALSKMLEIELYNPMEK